MAAAPWLAAAEEPFGRFEVTPYAAFRFGGEFDERNGERDFALDDHSARGLIFNVRAAAPGGHWEALYAHQATQLETLAGFDGGSELELDVDYLHFGGTYRFDGTSTRPFVAATAGAAHFSPRLPGFEAETYLSGSIGGGVQLRADKSVGVRLEGRVFGTFLDHDGEIFCNTSGVTSACALVADSALLIQWEVLAGIVFRF
jgi:hypothetical protein